MGSHHITTVEYARSLLYQQNDPAMHHGDSPNYGCQLGNTQGMLLDRYRKSH
jgi:hypothetical protein